MVNINLTISNQENEIVKNLKYIFKLNDKRLVIRKIIREFDKLKESKR